MRPARVLAETERSVMISVEFKGVGPGTCSWCRKDKPEVFMVVFGDRAFSGPMCWNDLRCAIRLKVADGKEEVLGSRVAPPNASA